MKVATGDLSEMEQLLKQLEHLMYGYNYQVTFGWLRLEGCHNQKDCLLEIKKNLRDSVIESFIEKTENELWEEVEFGLNSRGDETAGLELDQSQEVAVSGVQAKYRTAISKYLVERTEILSLRSFDGIPGYPVYWDFNNVLVNQSGNPN